MSVLRHSWAAGSALLALPGLGLACAVRPALRPNVGERLGATPRLDPGSIWVHGASLGEARLVSLLAGQLEDRGHPVFTSAQTATGRGARKRVRPSDSVSLAPFDHPWTVDRALDRISPTALIFCETEIWPVWLAAAARREIPVALVSARLSDRSLRGYRRIRPIMSRALRRVTQIGARNSLDAERFMALGAPPERVSVTGDLKRAIPSRPHHVAPDLLQVWPEGPVVIAGSTHAGEEQVILEAFDQLAQRGRPVSLVLAPRHLERAARLADQMSAEGRFFQKRTALHRPLSPGEVLLLDSHGELSDLYALADAAFVGGSLVDVGGHDPLEAARNGCPITVGPHTANIRETIESLFEEGAARCITGPSDLAAAWEIACFEKRSLRTDLAGPGSPLGQAALQETLALIESIVGNAA